MKIEDLWQIPIGWQPASSAPKDGTPFIAWEDGVMSICYWGDPKMEALSGGKMHETWICALIVGPLTPCDPGVDAITMCVGSDFTHWRLLPEAPE